MCFLYYISPLDITVAIFTPNKSTLNFEIAGPWSRVLAGFLDVIFLLATFFMVLFILPNAQTIIIFVLVLLITYSWWFEVITNGQTLGKMILGLRVIKTDGQSPEFNDYFLRWSMMMVDYLFTLFSLGLLLLYTTNKRQRLGDLLADTMVVSVKNKALLKIKNLEIENHKTSDIEINLPNLNLLREEDVLLAKQLISNFTIYKEPLLSELQLQAATKIADILNVKLETEPKIFIYNVLMQYIANSRN